MNAQPDLTPRTVSVPEAGRILGISQTKSYELAQRGEFPVRVLQIGRMKRVSISQLEAYLNGEEALHEGSAQATA
ncbi:helix-turn-helix transcriptional regulator [Glutamicibacter sp.]|uniref:helix-turn-helix transcriptional regulator n=1 Tax=Glutamicibacter sp. TaxID=1931995 RepID=UPI002FDF0C13